jgi:flavoprotein
MMTRFCTSCQTTQPLAGGKHVISAKHNIKRWKCSGCQKKEAERNANHRG